MPRRKEKLWRYTVGEKGFNRVTVYERKAGGPLHVEWFTPKRHQKSLKTLQGVPIFERDTAIRIAHRMSEAQRQKREAQTANFLLGIPEPHTLSELLKEYHRAHPNWSAHHKRVQQALREWWTNRLGEARPLSRIGAIDVQDHVHQEGLRQEWSARTRAKYLKYMVGAFYFAQRKLKWIGEQQNLSAVELPAGESVSRSYSLDEVAAVCAVSSRVDLRLAAAVEIAWATGRRINAIRSLRAEAYSVGWLQFPGETDKARKSGRAYLTESAKAAVEMLLQLPAVRASGLLFPAGDLMSPDPKRQPISDVHLTRLLHEAEVLADVETIKGRAFHGLKRRFATATEASTAAAKQSGTRKDTLQSKYEQDDPEPKIELAKKLERMRRKA